MRFEIEITAEAEADIDRIQPYYRKQILDNIETYLEYTPTQESGARIKRLRLLDSPAYRLRIGDFRLFYDVDESAMLVSILRVLSKDMSLRYLADLESQA